jgi:hypothetical protein
MVRFALRGGCSSKLANEAKSRFGLKLNVRALAAASVLSLAGIAHAEPSPGAAPSASAAPPSKPPAPDTRQHPVIEARDRATEIVTQPARDVGMSNVKIPPALTKASEDPYSLAGLKTCKQLAGAVEDLDEALGPDFGPGGRYQENRMAKLAQAGGKTVVNSILPFRSLVREVSGAAPADRRLRAAEEAGYARRGFLRGVHATRRCRPQL